MTDDQAYLIAAVSPAAVLAALIVGYCVGAIRERRRLRGELATVVDAAASTIGLRPCDGTGSHAWVEPMPMSASTPRLVAWRCPGCGATFRWPA